MNKIKTGIHWEGQLSLLTDKTPNRKGWAR